MGIAAPVTPLYWANPLGCMNFDDQNDKTMGKIVLASMLFFTLLSLRAQQEPDRALFLSLGLGNVLTSDDTIYDFGFFVQGEYVVEVASWLDVRPYAGFISVNPEVEDLRRSEVGRTAANAALFGTKIRLSVPIPAVAPFVELGIGASLGVIEGVGDRRDLKGLAYHVPFSVGLAFGRKNTVDLALTSFLHPSARQIAGMPTLGITIPF